jgi:hypothetical protein
MLLPILPQRRRAFMPFLLGIGLALVYLTAQAAPFSSTTLVAANAAVAPNKVFTLPAHLQANFSFIGKYGRFPLSGDGLLTWDTRADAANSAIAPYDASLNIGALFYKSTLKSQGVVTATGIHPRRTEEKVTGRNAIVIATDTVNARVSISGKEGFQPYDANGQDLLTVIAQLGVYVQTQPQWHMAGTEKVFSVYRPSGLKHWRFQSQGVQTVQFNGAAVSTVYVVELPESGAQDTDEKHHFWLDPSRHGFPIKLRKVKKNGDFVELTIKDWQESQ